MPHQHPPRRRRTLNRDIAPRADEPPRAITIVIGPPAAGKSTWVRQHANYGDIIIDFDRLAAALTAPTPPDQRQPVRTGLLARTTLAARQAAVDICLRTTTGRAFIIHATPNLADLGRYERARARIVAVDPGPDIVMARIAEQRQPSIEKVATNWYQQTRSSLPASVEWVE